MIIFARKKMKNKIFILLIVLFVVIFAVISQREVDKLKSEADRYEELYLNCQINHDLHMKSHEGEFQLN